MKIEQIVTVVPNDEFGGIIGQTEAMVNVRAKIIKAARTNFHVLITGESGTGKELVAQAIHALSQRATKPFIPVNCGAIPETLAESEFFGHIRGAFTGAVNQHTGLFSKANCGSLFLDEVAETSEAIQVKLFRAIQDKEVTPLGSSSPAQVNVRIIAASSENRLEKLRDELFYRLNAIRITLPSLRQRKEDIPRLAANFFSRATEQCGANDLVLGDDAVEALCAYDWPGNVRQLEHVIESAVALADGSEVQASDMKEIIANSSRLPQRTSTTTTPGTPESFVQQAIAEQMSMETFERGIRAMERQFVRGILDRTGGNKLAASKILGCSRSTISNKLGETEAEAAAN